MQTNATERMQQARDRLLREGRAYEDSADMVREPPPPKGRLYAIRGGLDASRPKRRIYVDTSVIGGCDDAEFMDASLALMDLFRTGTATMVVSSILREELGPAPQDVRDIPDSVPLGHREEVMFTPQEAGALADAYLDAGILPARSIKDARHIALASIHRVDALASWNFKDMVNAGRIPGYNAVNRELGYPALTIHTPTEEVQRHANQRS